MNFVLGTAGWRQEYGLGQEKPKTAQQLKYLIESAKKQGIFWIDTAPSYGDSQEIIGKIKSGLNIATKIEFKGITHSKFRNQIELALKQLQIDQIELIFIHDWDKLDIKEKLISTSWLNELLQSNQLASWGISSYCVKSLLNLSDFSNSPIHFQINCNILDQRLQIFLKQFSNPFKLLNGGEFWIRSIFLQGLLINSPLKSRYSNHKDIIKFFNYCEINRVNPMSIAISYIKSLKFCEKIIVGINSKRQLKQLLIANDDKISEVNWEYFASSDLLLTDPRNWKKSC